MTSFTRFGGQLRQSTDVRPMHCASLPHYEGGTSARADISVSDERRGGGDVVTPEAACDAELGKVVVLRFAASGGTKGLNDSVLEVADIVAGFGPGPV